MQPYTLGNTAYEITNYPPKDGRSLGNVNAVISDRKTLVSTVSAFKAVIIPSLIQGAAAPYVSNSVMTIGRLTLNGFKLYHNMYGMNGGYASLLGETISQTGTQIYTKGTVDFREYDIASLFTSAFITNSSGVLLRGAQGVQGTWISYTLNKGPQGAIFENKSNSYKIISSVNGLFGTFNGLGYFGDWSSGCMQGIIENIEDRHGFEKK